MHKYKIYPAIAFLLIFSVGCVNEISVEKEEIIIGALLDVTGDWSSLGESSKMALSIAVKDINNYLEKANSGKRVKLVLGDTKGRPETALKMLKQVSQKGAKFVIGPQSSAEVKALKDYADENGIIIVSHGSTAHSLAYPDDHIFRFVTDDMNEGKAMAGLMLGVGIRAVIPIWRDDAGNNGLQIAIDKNFGSVGGKVLDGEKYPPDTKDFINVLEGLNSKASNAVKTYGKGNVGIYLAAFDEAAEIFSQAGKYEALSNLRWYGSNGAALSKAIIENEKAAEFAVKAGYPCPINAEGKSEKYLKIKSRVKAKLGREPEAYAIAAYDALWVIAKTYIAAGSEDFDTLKKEFVKTADSYIGTTGSTALNDAGDRDEWDYDLWTVQKEDGKFRWVVEERGEQEKQKSIDISKGIDKLQVESFVTDAVKLIEKEGEDCFDEFRKDNSKWKFDNTYLFVWRTDGIRMVYPPNTSREGMSVLELEDYNGKPLGKLFIDIALNEGEGWINYNWPKPGQPKPSPKLTFIKKASFKDTTYLVGSGYYIEDKIGVVINDIDKCNYIEPFKGIQLCDMLHPALFEENFDIGYSIAYVVIGPGKGIQGHLMKNPESFTILEGRGELSINNEVFEVNKGQVVYVPPMAIQSIKNTGNSDLTFFAIDYPRWKPENEIRLAR